MYCRRDHLINRTVIVSASMLGAVMVVVILLLVASALGNEAHAQVKVDLVEQHEEKNGHVMGLLLRSSINKTKTLVVAAPDEREVVFRIHFLSMDPTDDGMTLVYSLVLTVVDKNDVYVNHTIGICGLNKFVGCAGTLTSFVERNVTTLVKSYSRGRL